MSPTSTPTRRPSFAALLAGMAGLAIAACLGPSATPTPAPPVALRLQVGLTPEEMATYEPQLKALDDAHPEWTIALEAVPQGSEVEKITNELAGDDLPDLLRVQGLNVQQWIRRGAFLDLDSRIAASAVDTNDFYGGPLAQFQWNDSVWGLPDTATPEVVYYNKTLFTEADVAFPTDKWTYDDMRTAAIALTVDGAGRHPDDADFDAATIDQWGWNGGLTYFWQDAFVRARGGEWCANADCTLMKLTDPATATAVEWWVKLVRDDHAALYDPYGGSQTGVPGDPFLSGKAAMGSNGSFAIGQLNAAGNIDYDIVPPLLGVDGKRYTPLSTNGYLISARSQHAEESWDLVQALLSPEFLSSTWGAPGHAVPARRSAAASIINDDHPPANQDAILAAMEVGEVFKPYTAGAFDAYGRTIDLFTKMNTGELAIPDALAQIEAAANEALAADREP